MIISPDDVGDAHRGVINDNGKIIGGDAVGPVQDEIIDDIAIKRDFSQQLVLDRHRFMYRSEPGDVGPAGFAQRLECFRVEVPAFAAVARRFSPGDLVPADRLKLLRRAETGISPPLRTPEDAAACIAGLLDGAIDCIATDHAPHAVEDKLCEFDQAAMGISGLETALGLCLSLVHD